MLTTFLICVLKRWFWPNLTTFSDNTYVLGEIICAILSYFRKNKHNFLSSEWTTTTNLYLTDKYRQILWCQKHQKKKLLAKFWPQFVTGKTIRKKYYHITNRTDARQLGKQRKNKDCAYRRRQQALQSCWHSQGIQISPFLSFPFLSFFSLPLPFF